MQDDGDEDRLFSSEDDTAVDINANGRHPVEVQDPMEVDEMGLERGHQSDGESKLASNKPTGLAALVDDDDDEDLSDSDDPITHEIPVFVSKKLAELFIFQYPTRKVDHPTPVAARYKPQGQRFELEIPIETHSSYYDKERGEQLGFGLTNEEKALAKDFEQHRNRVVKPLDMIKLHSSLPPTNAKYLAGTVRDGEIHLTPLTGIVQLRPTLSYIDKLSEKEKSAQTRAQEDDAAPVQEAKVVQMRVIQADDKEATTRKTEEALKVAYEAEQWVPLKYRDDRDSAQVLEEFEKLISDGDTLESAVTPTEYLDDMSPTISLARIKTSEATEFQKLVRPGLSMQELKLLPMNYHILGLMMNANLLQHSKILELLGIQKADDEVFRAIEQAAVLVRGVWVLRSELIYNGRIANARKVLLNLFNESETGLIIRQKLNDIANLPFVMITNMFQEIAYFVKGEKPSRDDLDAEDANGGAPSFQQGGGWRLKVLPDEVFCEEHQDLVQKQNELVRNEALAAIEAMEKVAAPKAKVPVVKREIKKEKPVSSVPAVTKAGRQVSESTNVKTYDVSGANRKERLEKLIKAIFADHGICSGEFLMGTITASVAKETKGSLLTPEDMTPPYVSTVINELCFPLHDVYALKVLNNANDNFRTAVLELLRSKRSGVKKSDVMNACFAATNQNPSQSVYQKVMKELAVSSGPSWELKPSPSL